METLKFVLPLTASNKAYMITAITRPVRNPKREGFGKVRIVLDLGYNPIIDDPDFRELMEESEAIELLKKYSFIQVTEDFDTHDVNDLKTIKSQLSQEWIDNFNLWINYTG